MKIYRIAKTRYANDLSGNGARIFGGRWNHKGTSMVYSSESRALATVEYLVHVPLSLVPTDLSLVTLQIPDEITTVNILISDLPTNWSDYPAPSVLAQLGTNWASKNESLLLRVPSAVVEHEFNILINPLHPDMKHMVISQIESYEFDNRLIR
jgi:RES domain-containing protein